MTPHHLWQMLDPNDASNKVRHNKVDNPDGAQAPGSESP